MWSVSTLQGKRVDCPAGDKNNDTVKLIDEFRERIAAAAARATVGDLDK